MIAYAGLATGILASDWTRAKVDMKHTGSMPSANEEEEEAKGEDSSGGERGEPASLWPPGWRGLGRIWCWPEEALKSDC